MGWEAFGAIGEMVGGLVVLVTLVFLSRQIRQSNKIGKAEAERDWFIKWHDLMKATAADPEIANLFRNGLNNYTDLDKNEKAVFSGYLISLLDHADVLRRLNAEGLVSDDLAQPVINVCLAFIESPGGKDWWGEVGPVMTIYPYMQSLPRDDVRPMTDMFSYYQA